MPGNILNFAHKEQDDYLRSALVLTGQQWLCCRTTYLVSGLLPRLLLQILKSETQKSYPAPLSISLLKSFIFMYVYFTDLLLVLVGHHKC